MMKLANPLFAKAAPLQSNRVETVGRGVSRCDRLGKWQYILGKNTAATNVGMCADAHVLMHWAKRADRRPVFHDYMPGERGRVGHDDVIADHAIMGDVGISHDQAMIANTREAATLRCR